MPRKADQTRLETLQHAITANPGQRPGFFARLFGWRREEVSRALVSLADRQVLLYEDDKGGLWPFSNK